MAVDENVILVSKEALFDGGENTFEGTLFQGTLFDEDKVVGYLDIISNNYQVMRRGSVDEVDTPVDQCAERNNDFKQPIPYVIIVKGDKYYVTERLSGAGESRLHGKLSMGIGGHMNPIEGIDTFHGIMGENTVRELNEELKIFTKDKDLNIEMGGLLNDDSNEVGQVHIGLLGTIKLIEDQEVEVKEVDQLKGAWYTLDELFEPEVFDRVESWGKIVLESIKNGEFEI